MYMGEGLKLRVFPVCVYVFCKSIRQQKMKKEAKNKEWGKEFIFLIDT